MLKSMSTSVFSVKIQKHLWFYLPQAYSDLLGQKIIEDNNDQKLENDKFTGTNEKNEKYLKKSHINTITSHCNKNEPLKLNDSSLKIKKQDTRKFKIIPKTTWLEIPETVLAFHVGPNLISWVYINSTFEVLDWNWKHWCDKREATATAYKLINIIPTLIETMPIAATYVMEDSKFPHKARDTKKMFIQHYLTTSIMSCIKLRNRLSLLPENVYVLDANTTARWFSLIIGSEVISTENITTSLLENKENGLSIFVNEEIKNRYRDLQKTEKEQINWSLLKAISFLCITEEEMKKQICKD